MAPGGEALGKDRSRGKVTSDQAVLPQLRGGAGFVALQGASWFSCCGLFFLTCSHYRIFSVFKWSQGSSHSHEAQCFS